MSDTTNTTIDTAAPGIGHNRPPSDADAPVNADVIIAAVLKNKSEDLFYQAKLTCYLWQHRTKFDVKWCKDAYNAEGKARTAFLDLTLKAMSPSFSKIAPKEKVKGEKKDPSRNQQIENANTMEGVRAARVMLARVIMGYTFFCLGRTTAMHINPNGSIRYRLADTGKGIEDDTVSASGAVRLGNEAAKKLWDKETPTRVKNDAEKALGNALKSIDHHLDTVKVTDGKVTTTVDNKTIALDPQLSADVQTLFAKMALTLFSREIRSADVISFILDHVPGVTVDGKKGKLPLSPVEAEKANVKTASNGVTVAKSATGKVVAFVKGKTKPAKK